MHDGEKERKKETLRGGRLHCGSGFRRRQSRSKKRQLTLTVYDTHPMTPTTVVGLSMRLSMSELLEIVGRDIFLYSLFFFLSLSFSFIPLSK